MSRLRCEVFGDNGRFAEHAFHVEVAELGAPVRVRADQSMLDVWLEAGVGMGFRFPMENMGTVPSRSWKQMA